jgi:hypothetical protein
MPLKITPITHVAKRTDFEHWVRLWSKKNHAGSQEKYSSFKEPCIGGAMRKYATRAYARNRGMSAKYCHSGIFRR